MPQRVQQPLRFQQLAAALGVERNRIGARGDGVFIAPDQQFRAYRASHLVAKAEHLGKLEASVHMQQREGNRRRVEGLLRQPQHDGRILADRVEHDRTLEFRGYFAQNVNALGFEQLQMAQAWRGGGPRGR